MAVAQPVLGTLLKEHNLVTEEQIQYALHEQKATGERLGECLQRLGLVTDSDLARVLAKQSGLPFIDLRAFTPDTDVLRRLPAQVARQKQILPLWTEDGVLHIAVADPYDPTALETVFRITGHGASIHVGAQNEIKKLIERFYYLLEHPIDREIDETTIRLRNNPEEEIDVGHLVDLLLTSAISQRATDVHITPSDRSTRVMFRVDGVMRPAYVFPINLHQRLITNIKVRAGMDISEQRRPQDGRMAFEFVGDQFDIRISAIRTNFGQNLVLRLLPTRGSSSFSLYDLGFDENELLGLKDLFSHPYGMVLVTGPTGSGKTTTLYAALRELNAIGRNILTVEDPIEYEFLMIRQTQVAERAGYTFASAIRTFLRQDPDVILVGEIRDEETAILATRAALTGHLVLSTLHTNTALGAIARLRDLGISPFLLSTSLVGVLAQRLVRRLCNHCKQAYKPSKKLLDRFNLPQDATYYKPGACEQCQGSGYLGRTAVAELLITSKQILKLIAEDAPLGLIEEQARKEGLVDLAEVGRQKVLEGITSLEELQRVIG